MSSAPRQGGICRLPSSTAPTNRSWSSLRRRRRSKVTPPLVLRRPFAVAVRAIVGIDPFAGGDLRRTRGLGERHARPDDEGDNGGRAQRSQDPILHSSSDTRLTIASRWRRTHLRRLKCSVGIELATAVGSLPHAPRACPGRGLFLHSRAGPTCVGEGWGGGSWLWRKLHPPSSTPTPNPSPQGGGKRTVRVAHPTQRYRASPRTA